MPDTRPIRATVRTCVGCGQVAAPMDLVRVVQDGEGGVAIDIGGRLRPRRRGVSTSWPGRGAWLHVRPRCVEGAARRGLARSFRTALKVGPSVLTLRLRVAGEERVSLLLGHARRAGWILPALARGAKLEPPSTYPLLLLARDAALGMAARGELAARAASTLVWGTRAELGRTLGHEQVDALAVVDERIAQALSRALEMVYVPGPVADGAGPKAYSEAG